MPQQEVSDKHLSRLASLLAIAYRLRTLVGNGHVDCINSTIRFCTILSGSVTSSSLKLK